MATVRRTVLDASVLINFLGLERFDLLLRVSHRALFVTGEVDAQIRKHRAAFDAALRAGQIALVNPLLDEEESALFVRLAARLGHADASCILAAKVLAADLAMDDLAARQAARQVLPLDRLLDTERLLAEAVRARLLTIDEGDALLQQLPLLKYRPKLRTLRELL